MSSTLIEGFEFDGPCCMMMEFDGPSFRISSFTHFQMHGNLQRYHTHVFSIMIMTK